MPNPSVTLDASILIAITDRRDPHHERAVTFIRKSLLKRALHVHPLNIAEAAVRPTTYGQAQHVRELWSLLGIRQASVDEEQPWRLAEIRAKTGLGLADCCVIDTARASKSGIATFDLRLASRAAELGVELALT